ncbi:hypothetical protein VLK31_33970 [Variovorax sp. H27-G14]|uniref:hypothetical protein n=1 Tax=Variovorax sp. H27-G14 TaxID=3111914 RepID=UPI0038FCFF56
MQKITGRLAAFIPAVALLAAAAFWHGKTRADDAAPVQSYNDIVAAYKTNPQQAATKYTQKRLAFSGRVMRMGSDAGGTYFGAVTDDGAQFDTHFEVNDQEALKRKFKDQKMTPFQFSSNIVFDCLNEGFLATALVPSPKFTHCRLVK